MSTPASGARIAPQVEDRQKSETPPTLRFGGAGG